MKVTVEIYKRGITIFEIVSNKIRLNQKNVSKK